MGTIAAGVVKPGDVVKVLPSGKESKVKRIVTFDGDLDYALPGEAVTLTLEDEIDISRGDLLVAPEADTSITQRVLANVVWMTEEPLQPHRQYDIKLATRKTRGHVDAIRHRIDVNTLEQHEATELKLNEIGLLELSLTNQIGVDPYDKVRDTGSFIVIDRLSNVTIGAGMVVEALADKTTKTQFSEFELELNALVRKHFPHWQALDIGKL